MTFLRAIPRAMLRVVVGACLFLFCMGIVGIGAVILNQQSDGVWARRYVAVIPLPAARVNGTFVLYRDVLDRWETIDRFLAARPIDAPNGQEIRPRAALRKEAYEQLIREAYIRSLAKQEAFTVSQRIIDTNIENLLNQASSTIRSLGTASSTVDGAPTIDEMNEYLVTTFGWTFDQFRDRVIVPALREEGVAKILLTKTGSTMEEWQAEVDAFLASKKVRRYLVF